METNEKNRSKEPLVDFKRLRLFVVYPALGLLGLWFCYLWLVPAFYGLTVAMGRKAELSPLLKQAKAARLDYEQVLAAPAASEGKPVIWCVRNRSEHDVTVEGKDNKRLVVSNYPGMPIYMGSKHQACTPMLLIVEKAAPGRPVTVFFKDAPETH